MPLFEYQCNVCGQSSEILVFGKDDEPECRIFGSRNLTKRSLRIIHPYPVQQIPKCRVLGILAAAGLLLGRQKGAQVREAFVERFLKNEPAG